MDKAMLQRLSSARSSRFLAAAVRGMRDTGAPGLCSRFLLVLLLAGSTLPAAAVPAMLPDLVSILESTPEGQWVRVNNNNFQDVWAPPELRPLRGLTNSPPYAIIRSWSSFAWDTNRGDLIIYGGGHANYSGNEVYRWRGSTGMWERASLPSQVTIVNNNYIPVDGAFNAPQSAHTYDNAMFLPILDRMLTFGGASTNSGGSYFLQTGPTTVRKTGPYLFDPAAADGNRVGGTTGSHVQRVAPHPEILGGEMWMNRDLYSRPLPVLPGNFINGTTGYAQQDGKDVVYVSAGNNLFKYTINDLQDPSQDGWEVVGRKWTGCCSNAAGAFDPVNNVFIRTGSLTAPVSYWDLDLAGPKNNNRLATPVDPSGEFVMSLSYGMDYDPIRHEMLLWKGGSEVWALLYDADLTNWRLERRGSADPTAPPTSLGRFGGGVLGKWKYVPNLDAFIGLESEILGNIWLYKPEGWVNPLLNPPDLSALYGSTDGSVALASFQSLAAASSVPEPHALLLAVAALGLAWRAARFKSSRRAPAGVG